jgi:hypothetical protein
MSRCRQFLPVNPFTLDVDEWHQLASREFLERSVLPSGLIAFFSASIDLVGAFLQRDICQLATFNRALIEAVVHQLKLPMNLVDAPPLASDGSGARLLLQLVQAVGCDVYLSAPSGRDYLDISIFKQAGIEVQFQHFHHGVYPQLNECWSIRCSELLAE